MVTVCVKVSYMSVCQDCGIEYPYLQRAHILAKHKGGDKDKSNIILICPNCHWIRDHDERIEFIKNAWTPLRRKQHSDRMKGRTWSTNPDRNFASYLRSLADTNSPEAQLKRTESLKNAWVELDWSDRNKKVAQAMKGNKNGLGKHKLVFKKWGNGLDYCQICNTSERKHKARGLCNACYLKVYRGNPL